MVHTMIVLRFTRTYNPSPLWKHSLSCYSSLLLRHLVSLSIKQNKWQTLGSSSTLLSVMDLRHVSWIIMSLLRQFYFLCVFNMTLSQNIKRQNAIISDIHNFGITEERLEALHSLGLQETLFLTFTVWKK